MTSSATESASPGTQRRETGVNFVFANQAESRATVMRYLTASQLDLANVTLDPYTELGNLAGSGMLPATLFYDDRGRLIDTCLGALSAATLEKTRPVAAPPVIRFLQHFDFPTERNDAP